MNYCIRQIRVEDLEDVVAVDNSYELERYSISQLKDLIEDEKNINLLCCVDERVIGYVSSSVILDEAELLKIVVCEDYRNTGVGEILITSLLDEFRSRRVGKVFLEVSSFNENAIRFYKKFNFRKINKRQKYYEDGSDAEIYVLEL